MPLEELQQDDNYHSRILNVSEGVSVTINWPGFFWYVFDWLSEDGWDADATVCKLWRIAGDAPIQGSQYATFKHLLEQAVERDGDAAAALFEGRANNNLT